MNDKLDVLSQIKAVEAPPFLLTRIKQQIDNERSSQFSPSVSWALGFSMVLVMSLNIAILFNNQSNSEEKTQNIAQSMQLLQKNDFYNE